MIKLGLAQDDSSLVSDDVGTTSSGALPASHGEPGNTGGTPTSDGRNAYSLFGTGIASSHTLEGKQY